TLNKKASAFLLKEIIERLKPLQEVGVGYLTLDRSCKSLSGGELQRIRIASQLYSGLSGVLYVLDEPSIGLHSRDTVRLIKTLNKLRDKGNSVVVVEHDRDIIKAADYGIDFGPGAGEKGGEVIFEGTLEKLKKAKSETALYLQNKKTYKIAGNISTNQKLKKIKIVGATQNNLKNIDLEIPLNCMVAVAGVSGGGKSSLVNDVISKGIRREFLKTKENPGKHKRIEGLQNLSKIVVVDQAPIGKSPRSNPATYTGVFGQIRELFARTEEARKRGYKASHFSFNMRGGRCEYCQGDGVVKIEMRLLDDVFAICPHCQGKRYNKKVLEIEYHGSNIADILNMNIGYAYHFFHANEAIREKLKCLCDVGLDYLKLGQNAMNLSGGEAQRVKLATELSRKSKGNCLYILDEPTIGLHFSDTEKLLTLLNDLIKMGNSVLIVEHNLDIIRVSDWIIELGPEGGTEGGKVIFEGTLASLKNKKTPTGELLG
nr:ATP-binding cassette domain-containing protein [Patescibacteria group bacterium]